MGPVYPAPLTKVWRPLHEFTPTRRGFHRDGVPHDGGVLDAADDARAQRGNRLTATGGNIEPPVASGAVVGARDTETVALLSFRVERLHIGRHGERQVS
jgi:hypothetical protein